MDTRAGRGGRSSALVAGTLALALFGGAAFANPAAFERAVGRATSVLFGPPERAEGPGGHGGAGGGGGSGERSHDPDECTALVDAYGLAAPPSGDVRGIEHAIEVVEANCRKNPQAKGLLTALDRLLRNAERHAAHGRGPEERGRGHGRALGHDGRGHGGGGRPADPGAAGDHAERGRGGS